MRETSFGYDPFAQVRQVDARISFEVIAKALNKKLIDVVSIPRFGAGRNTLNGVPELAKKYATTEKFGWPLDSTCYIMPDSGAERGCWLWNISDGNGNFSAAPEIQYYLPSDTVTFGWTFHFDAPADVKATVIRATCYDAENNVIDEAEGVVDGAFDPPRPEIIVGIEPEQYGTWDGAMDPAPDHECPIYGWDEIRIYVDSTDGSHSRRYYIVNIPDEVGTVYGGTYDALTGRLSIDRKKVVLTSVTGATSAYAMVRVGDYGYVDDSKPDLMLCNLLKKYSGSASGIGNNQFNVFNSGGYNQAHVIFKFDGYDGTVASANAWLQEMADSGAPVEVVFPLAEPVVYYITPNEIRQLEESDVVSAQCGPILSIRSIPGNREKIERYGDGYVWDHFVRDYRRVDFLFYGTNQPYRMLRLTEVDFGISKHFDRTKITDARIKYGMTPDASAFPAKQITFSFDNSDGAFNVLNPIGVYQYWRNGQVLTAKIQIGNELIDMGMFYVTRAEIGKNRLLAKVTAHDQTYQLANQKFYPDDLAAQASVRLDVAVPRALIGTDLSVDYGGLGAEPVSCAVRDTHDKRTILRYFAQAARATLWIDRDNTLRFRRIETAAEEVGAITADELYDWSGVSIAEEFTGSTLAVPRELEKDEDGNDVVEYYASGVSDDEGSATAAYENPCVAPGQGQAVADWLLVMANRRKKYAVKNRCDPAVEIGDTLVIADAFRNDDRAVVTGLEIVYNGGLYATTEADREF